MLATGLRAVFVGTSVGTKSHEASAYYANPTNAFWRLLHKAGLTAELLQPLDYRRLLEFGLGLTDVTGVVSSSDATLTAEHYDVPGFRAEIASASPGVIAFNGKPAARVVGAAIGENDVAYGLRNWTFGGAAVFVLPSSSGTNTSMTFDGKLEWWARLARLL